MSKKSNLRVISIFLSLIMLVSVVTISSASAATQITITLKANKGVFPDGTTSKSFTCNSGKDIPLPQLRTDKIPTRDGYDFMGFYQKVVTASGSSIKKFVYNANSWPRVSSDGLGNVTLYADWLNSDPNKATYWETWKPMIYNYGKNVDGNWGYLNTCRVYRDANSNPTYRMEEVDNTTTEYYYCLNASEATNPDVYNNILHQRKIVCMAAGSNVRKVFTVFSGNEDNVLELNKPYTLKEISSDTIESHDYSFRLKGDYSGIGIGHRVYYDYEAKEPKLVLYKVFRPSWYAGHQNADGTYSNILNHSVVNFKVPAEWEEASKVNGKPTTLCKMYYRAPNSEELLEKKVKVYRCNSSDVNGGLNPPYNYVYTINNPMRREGAFSKLTFYCGSYDSDIKVDIDLTKEGTPFGFKTNYTYRLTTTDIHTPDLSQHIAISSHQHRYRRYAKKIWYKTLQDLQLNKPEISYEELEPREYAKEADGKVGFGYHCCTENSFVDLTGDDAAPDKYKDLGNCEFKGWIREEDNQVSNLEISDFDTYIEYMLSLDKLKVARVIEDNIEDPAHYPFIEVNGKNNRFSAVYVITPKLDADVFKPTQQQFESPTDYIDPIHEIQEPNPTVPPVYEEEERWRDTRIEWIKDVNTLKIGKTLTLGVKVTDALGKTTFTTSNKAVATVSAAGVVKGLKAGTVTITATNNNVSISRKITIERLANTATVKGKTVTVSAKSLTTGKSKKSFGIAKTKAFTISKAETALTFKKVSGNSKITINKTTGAITVKNGLKKGTYSVGVEVAAAKNAKYNAKTIKTTVKIVVK